MEELPDEVLLEIVRRVVLVRSSSPATRGEEAACCAAAVLRDVGSLSRVSSRWRAVVATDSLWRDLYKHRWMNHNRHLVREQDHQQIDQQFDSFYRAHKPLCWKAFYLREVRRPMTELLRGVDWDSLRLSKLGWTGLQDSALARSEEDGAVRELRAASRSERLREALASYPPAFRRRLRERLEMLHVRCSFLHRIQNALFLAKVGLGVYALRRLAPSLCPLPDRFVAARRLPGAASALAVLAGFWPLLSYTAAYSVVQHQLGAKSYLGGCGRNWRLCAAKFGVRVLHSLLEEIGLRWLCVSPFVMALVATNGLLKAVTFILALVGSYTVLETLNQHSTRRAPSDDTKISMFSFAVACYVARFDLVLGTVATLVLPLFHRLTRNAYRDVIKEAGSAPPPPQPYLHLFVLGLFAVSSLAQLSHTPPWLTEKLATAAAAWRPTARVWDYLSAINTSRQPAAFLVTLRASLAGLTTAPHGSRSNSDESESEAKRQLGECLRAVHGHVVGWVMCHAALRHGLPTAVALKLVYEAELLLCHLAAKALTRSRNQSTS